MLATKWDSPRRIDLKKFKTDETDGLDRDEGEKRFAELGGRLDELQERMYAAGQNGLLVVLQGRDTSGKDGTLKAVGGTMNPTGIRIADFKAPTPEELSHDFLWRVHKQAPGRGQVVFFNRSHYESVLVERVHHLVPDDVWERRYEQINAFEQILRDAGIIVLKFCLLISKDEQKKRLLAREKEPVKAWKINVNDWEERKYWDEYTEAYADAVSKCAAPHAPWFLVPADHKWFRNLAIAEAIVETLAPYEKAWDDRLKDMGREGRAAVAKLRETDPELF